VRNKILLSLISFFILFNNFAYGEDLYVLNSYPSNKSDIYINKLSKKGDIMFNRDIQSNSVEIKLAFSNNKSEFKKLKILPIRSSYLVSFELHKLEPGSYTIFWQAKPCLEKCLYNDPKINDSALLHSGEINFSIKEKNKGNYNFYIIYFFIFFVIIFLIIYKYTKNKKARL
jgi:hypothetical protein